MTNWKTNLGGAIGIIGSSLFGIGSLTQLTQLSPNSTILSPHQLAVLWYVAVAGIVISAIGKGLTSLFAADAAALKQVVEKTEVIAQKTEANTNQIATTKAVVDAAVETKFKE